MNKDNKLEVAKSRDGDFFYIKINDRIDWYDPISILDPVMPNMGNYFFTKEDAEAAKFKLLANLDIIELGVHNYFYINVNGEVCWHPSDTEHVFDIAMFDMGNYFLTEEAAQSARPDMLKKLNEIVTNASRCNSSSYFYLYIGVNGSTYWGPFDKNQVFDLAMLHLGNYFSTEEAAEAAKSEMLKKFESIQKRIRELGLRK